MVRLMDGEIATQLLKYEKETEDDPLWCSRFNVTAPESVYKCYMDFLQAGCEILRTNTYQSSLAGFQQHLHLTAQESQELFHSIVQLAHKARADYLETSGATRKIEIFASAGSFGAYLHDGSEYTGSFLDSISVEVIRKFHKDRLDILLTTGQLLDGVAVETIPSVVEAEIVVGLFNDFYPEVNYWISFNCKDDRSTARNEPFGEVVEKIWGQARGKSQLIGVGVNCLDPKLVSPLFELVGNPGRTESIPLIAYPNSGEKFDVDQRRWIEMPDCKDLSYYVAAWKELGMRTIGGCCRNGSREIMNLRQYLDGIEQKHI